MQDSKRQREGMRFMPEMIAFPVAERRKRLEESRGLVESGEE